ncbi:MAG TPA: hypothetical protein VE093_12060 [Polyangiaceae bacterium]|jgi:hypothetical protein|nr:hypothetical protein [Polyangiaceae bacterium]
MRQSLGPHGSEAHAAWLVSKQRSPAPTYWAGEHWGAGAIAGDAGDEGGDETGVSPDASWLAEALGSSGGVEGADAHPNAKSAAAPTPAAHRARML